MRNKWKARGPNSSKKTDVLESSQDIVHQSAMSLVPEVLYPEMGINEVEQAAARQVRAGCHDVDTVNDPGLPDRTQDSWVKLHCALLKKRLIKALSIDSDLRANSLAEEDKAQAKVANLEAKEERIVANINETEARVIEKKGRDGLAEARTLSRWRRWRSYAVLLVILFAEIAFDYSALGVLNADMFSTLLIALLLACIPLMSAHTAGEMHALHRVRMAVFLDVVTILLASSTAALLAYLRSSHLSEEQSQNAATSSQYLYRLFENTGGLSDGGMNLPVVTIVLFVVSFLLPISFTAVLAAGYEPLYDELLKYRGQLKKIHKSLEAAREKEVSIRRRCESLLAKEDLYELETAADIDAVQPCAEERSRRYDIALLEDMGAPDATSAVADTYRDQDPQIITPSPLRAV
ncbi:MULTISPECIES: hypothetical protein [unclassified Actinomyces]|jgi:hypothetical protein|uniref:hypothetical protein n=1 Tax=Actinomyces sp. ICM47 TaxID=936548 RepID=UPI00027330C6|nr:hypothetical protein [Actinomyces sp. ICM47]EJG15329.1 hypothetical protein HMPREF1136_1696 [Actinomyces sp. ICM47]